MVTISAALAEHHEKAMSNVKNDDNCESRKPIVVTIDEWFKDIRSEKTSLVTEVPLDELEDWSVNEDSGNIEHKNGHFFSIIGLEVEAQYGPCDDIVRWNQPIIRQAEIGVLGIVKQVVGETTWFLMQAKIEPGNINQIQISPTVQATRSNYTRAHGGQKTRFLDHFFQPDGVEILHDRTWSEQGGRFLQKKNRNLVVETRANLDPKLFYRWLKYDDLRALIHVPNVINMDTRSVLSTMITQCPSSEQPLHSLPMLYKWRDQFVSRNHMSSRIVPLKSLSKWKRTEYEIREESENNFFTINAVKVTTEAREIRSWDQPLIKDIHIGLIGFLVTVINDTVHFLVQGKLEAGSNTPIILAPTVQCAAYRERHVQNSMGPNFVSYFLDPNGVILYDTVQSDEGGRFFKVENRHAVVIIRDHSVAEPYENYAWLSYNQVVHFLELGFFNVEARSLLACYILSKGGLHESTSLGLP